MAAKKKASKIEKVEQEDRGFGRVVAAFAENPKVTREDRKGFGSGALKVNGKIFATISSRGKFVVKLPRERVDQLVAAGLGERFDPGHGRLMKEWVIVRGDKANWVDVAREACNFVQGRN